ncbi:MAG TPA: sigma-70 family RNA polymerase sigma factor [Planctomycetota bacterium]|nr:sigma-70 family RNA polymerase sigma factor [Planctomycetota bacterium]
MAEPDTAIRQGQSQFPPTAWSLLSRLRDPRDPRVREYLNRMVELYWRPVYKYVRLGWKKTNEDAKDLTQAFFVHLLEGTLLETADPDRGNFRKLLMAALRNFLSNEVRSASAQKRGGQQRVFSLDAVEIDWPSEPADPKAAYDAQWAREVLTRAIERLQSNCRPEVFGAFQRFHLENASVREIAGEQGKTEAQVGHFLQDARAALRRFVTDEIREYVADDAELGRELDSLFGAWRGGL